MKNTMTKTKVVRGVAIFAISTGLSLWNMESQEVVALAPVSIESSLKSRVQLWQESLPAADAASVTCKIEKLDHVRKIRVRQYEQELKRIREENARRKRMLEIRKYCGVNITDSDRVILEKIVQAEAGNQASGGKCDLKPCEKRKVPVNDPRGCVCTKTVFTDRRRKLCKGVCLAGYQKGSRRGTARC